MKLTPNDLDRWNQTPLSEAVRFGHLHIAAYLRSFIDKNPNQNWESSAQAYEAHDAHEDDEMDGDNDVNGEVRENGTHDDEHGDKGVKAT